MTWVFAWVLFFASSLLMTWVFAWVLFFCIVFINDLNIKQPLRGCFMCHKLRHNLARCEKFQPKPQLVGGGEILSRYPKFTFQNRPVSSINSVHTNIYNYIIKTRLLFLCLFVCSPRDCMKR